jgi:Holliday junction resolvase
MVALTPGHNRQERVTSTLEEEGFAVIRTTIGGNSLNSLKR